jgi:hypothetical protein
LPTNNQFSGQNMGIRVLNAAVTTTFAAMRTSGISQALPIEYAPSNDPRPGSTLFANALELVAFMGNAGWQKTQELRVNWAATPRPPETLVDEVQAALRSWATGSIAVHTGPGAQNALRATGARAFTDGADFVGAGRSSFGMMGHEATHVTQGRGARQIADDSDNRAVDDLLRQLRP